MQPQFKFDLQDVSDPSEKSFKEAITIKLQNQIAQLVPGSMSLAKPESTNDPKDFYFSLKKITQLPVVADLFKFELSRFLEIFLQFFFFSIALSSTISSGGSFFTIVSVVRSAIMRELNNAIATGDILKTIDLLA